MSRSERSWHIYQLIRIDQVRVHNLRVCRLEHRETDVEFGGNTTHGITTLYSIIHYISPLLRFLLLVQAAANLETDQLTNINRRARRNRYHAVGIKVLHGRAGIPFHPGAAGKTVS